MSEDWHGWGVGRRALHVGPLPGRKQVCLYVHDGTDGSVIRTLAFFKTEEQARTALNLLDGIARASHRPPYEEAAW